jgi:hypothetical protein
MTRGNDAAMSEAQDREPSRDNRRRMAGRLALLALVLLALAACQGGAPAAAPYDRGCAFDYRCFRNSA